MLRKTYSFEEFNEFFIQKPDGFFPVWSWLKEDNDGNLLNIVEIDLICEWRLPDGKVLFLQVPFSSKSEFDAIVEYLAVAANLLNDAILTKVDELKNKYSTLECLNETEN